MVIHSSFFFKQPRLLIWIESIIILLIIGYVDYFQGFQYSFSIFYLIPISIITWAGKKQDGIFLSLISSIVWYLADYYSHPLDADLIILGWNSILRLGFFLVVTLLLSSLKQVLERESFLARRDYLTGTWNRRAFFEMADMEFAMAERNKYALTLAYIDLDNFKSVNDKFGHKEGDRLLKLVSSIMNKGIRKTDILARLGGDEFAIFLPRSNADDSRTLLERLRNELLKNMQINNWPVTFSIGLITYTKPLKSLQDMIEQTDHLMYSVKKSGKNNLVQKVIS